MYAIQDDKITLISTRHLKRLCLMACVKPFKYVLHRALESKAVFLFYYPRRALKRSTVDSIGRLPRRVTWLPLVAANLAVCVDLQSSRHFAATRLSAFL